MRAVKHDYRLYHNQLQGDIDRWLYLTVLLSSSHCTPEYLKLHVGVPQCALVHDSVPSEFMSMYLTIPLNPCHCASPYFWLLVTEPLYTPNFMLPNTFLLSRIVTELISFSIPNLFILLMYIFVYFLMLPVTIPFLFVSPLRVPYLCSFYLSPHSVSYHCPLSQTKK